MSGALQAKTRQSARRNGRCCVDSPSCRCSATTYSSCRQTSPTPPKSMRRSTPLLSDSGAWTSLFTARPTSDRNAFGSVVETGSDVVAAQITPKVQGLLHLLAAMDGRQPQRWIIHGSISAELGGLGLAAYAGANAVLDGIAERGARAGQDWLNIEWDAWDNAGEAQAHALKSAPIKGPEGQDVFLRAIGTPLGSRVVVAVQTSRKG